MDFPPNILRRLFFSRPLKLLSNGGFWLSGENQTKTGMLMRPPSLPRALFFALLHPRNLQEGPSVVEAFSSSLDVCGVNPAVARASKLSKVSVFTLALIPAEFLPPLLSESLLCPPRYKKKKESMKRLFLYMPSLRWQLYHMHFALKLKLAFSITLLLPGCFDVFSKGQVCVCIHACVHGCWLFSLMCVGICLMCVQPYGAGR